jgi:hypothetical protein
MSQIINLRRARKTRDRADARAGADANAARHGRSKSAKAQHGAERDLARRTLDAHRRETPDAPGDDS